MFPSWFAVALIDPLTNMVQATQSVGTTETSFGTQPTLTDFDTELVDTDGFHGATTSRITVPSGMDGDYWVFMDIGIQSTNIIQLFKNGGPLVTTCRNGTPDIGANNNKATHGHITWFETLVAGDYFDVSIYCGPGWATDFNSSYLGMLKLDSEGAPWPYEQCGFVPQIYRRL